jgi:hypothetical protein
MRLQAITGRHRGTISRVLVRHGVSRRRRPGAESSGGFESSQPGALLHIDACSAPKLLSPGHRVTSCFADEVSDGGTLIATVRSDWRGNRRQASELNA